MTERRGLPPEAMYLDDDLAVLLSPCLIGNSAGAAVLSAEPAAHQRRLEWKTTPPVLKPTQWDALRFYQRDVRLRNLLTLQVLTLPTQAVEDVLG